MTGAALAVSTICLWVVVLTWISFRWSSARRVIDGVPVLLLKDGRATGGARRPRRCAGAQELDALAEELAAHLVEAGPQQP